MNNSFQLYINGQLASTPNDAFTYNLQVNTMFDFEKRATSFSFGLKLPKTTENQQIFSLSGIVGVKTDAPYKKFDVSFKVNGLQIVSNGWGYLQEVTPDYFLFWFQDGNVELYKALEDNKINAVLKESESNFSHTLSVPILTLLHKQKYPKYTYAVADYGQGNARPYNFDYCVPCVSCDWILKEVFKAIGFEFSGKFFDSAQWKQLYMTVPNSKSDKGHAETYSGKIEDISINNRPTIPAGEYKIIVGYTMTAEVDWEAIDAVNSQARYPEDEISPPSTFNPVVVRFVAGNNVFHTDTLRIGERRIIEKDFSLKETSHVGFSYFHQSNVINTLKGTLKIVSKTSNPLKDFDEIQVKDWLKAIMNMFSLTPIQDKKNKKKYHFYTLDQRLIASPILNWSDKFVKITSETFNASGYGQKNTFAFKKYDNESKQQDYADYHLFFENNNLDKSAKFENFFYAPLQDEEGNNIFEFWQRKIVLNNGTVGYDYDKKDNRIHLLNVTQETKNLQGSMASTATASGRDIFVLNNYHKADFQGLTWRELHDKYYRELPKTIGRPSYIKAYFNLTEMDIYTFDFYSRIYVNALGALFLPLRIQYKVGELSVVELLKIPVIKTTGIPIGELEFFFDPKDNNNNSLNPNIDYGTN